MTGPDAARLHAAAYAPGADDLRRQFADLGEGLAAQCAEIQRAPTAERCERFALNCEGARRTALMLRQALLGEGVRNGE